MFTLREMQSVLLGSAQASKKHDFTVFGVATDSRSVQSGDLFVCIEGDNFDGHEFASQAIKNKASAVLASRLMPEIDSVPVLIVPDTVKALGSLAAHRRAATKAKVVAVTGTAGKTTVKEILATTAALEKRVSKNAGNLNNQIGLPLSIFRAEMDADIWFMELGISLPHDMDELGSIVKPDIVVIHNIGPAHLEGLGDIQGVAKAKTSLLTHLAPSGTALINRDYDLLWREAVAIRPDSVGFSTKDENCDFYCTLLETTPEGKGRFRLKTPAIDAEMVLPVCGSHHAENLAAVATVHHHLGLSPQALLRGASDLRSMQQRFACQTIGKVTLIDDSYNANPMSMLSSMATAKDMANGRALVFILGDMKELGELATQAHTDLGSEAKKMNPTALIFKGDHAHDVALGYDASNKALVEVKTPAQTASQIRNLSLKDGVILVKGSRSCRMEEHAKALLHELNKKDAAS